VTLYTFQLEKLIRSRAKSSSNTFKDVLQQLWDDVQDDEADGLQS
jgi:hypothetical protein